MKRVFIICPGLEHVHRGFETHGRQLYSILKDKSNNQTFLLKGSGSKSVNEKRVFTIKSGSSFSKLLCRLTKQFPRYFQNTSFFYFSLLFFIIKKPDSIYFGDPMLYHYYTKWRKISKQKFKIFFYTGGQSIPEKFNKEDTIIASTLHFYKKARLKKIPEANIILLPIGFYIDKDFAVLSEIQKSKIKETLHIPTNLPVVLSVGVLNHTIKRMDYLINEVSKLNTKVFLVLLGDQDNETDHIKNLAKNKLKKDSFLIKTVKPNEISAYYSIATVFALASLKEGFGRVYIETLSHGLPVLAHDFEVARNVLGDYGFYGDFTKAGSLQRLLERELEAPDNNFQEKERHAYAYDHYSWEVLEEVFVNLFNNKSL